MGNCMNSCFYDQQKQYQTYLQAKYKYIVLDTKDRRQNQKKMYICHSANQSNIKSKSKIKKYQQQPQDNKNPQISNHIIITDQQNEPTASYLTSKGNHGVLAIQQKELSSYYRPTQGSSIYQNLSDKMPMKPNQSIIEQQSYKLDSRNSQEKLTTSQPNENLQNAKLKSSILKKEEQNNKNEASEIRISQQSSIMNQYKMIKYQKQILIQKDASRVNYLKHRLIQGLILNDDFSQKTEAYYNECYQFYNQCQTAYFQEIINLNNSMSLYYSKWKRHEQAIQLLQQTIDLQFKYYSKQDQRHILAYNNMACAYYESNNPEKGKQYINKCNEIILKQQQTNKIDNNMLKIKKLIQSNYHYYTSRLSQSNIEQSPKGMVIISKLQSLESKIQPS